MTDPAVHANLLAERAVVGACLQGHPLGLGSLDIAVDLTDPRLVAVATACRRLLDAGQTIDPVMVLTGMQANASFPWGRSAAAGVYLLDLASVAGCPIPAQSTVHAQTVRAATARRRLVAAGVRLTDLSAGDLDPELVADTVTAELLEVVAALGRIVPARAAAA